MNAELIMGDINEFELRAIPELLEKNFFIPDYQRGYRWTEFNIKQLLSDIWDFANNGNPKDFYCLQPIVLKECSTQIKEKYNLESLYDGNRWYEVIDGQQRLTTIRLIIEMNNLLQPLGRVRNIFNIFYETRPELQSIFTGFTVEQNDEEQFIKVNRDNIDNYYITLGLSHIFNWFTTEGEAYEKRATLHQFPLFFSAFFGNNPKDNSHGKSTQVLWYCINEEDDKAKSIFRRLNDTKIPLSNSELIKALFLSDNSFYKPDLKENASNALAVEYEKKQKQLHIAKMWELFEHKLSNPGFWSFITNRKPEEYSSHIELLFDFISKKYGVNKANSCLLYTSPSPRD